MEPGGKTFNEVVDEYYRPLYRFAMSLTRSEADAGDLTQQTFYTWALKGHQLRDPTKVKFWLFTTLHRAFLSTRRSRSRFVHEELDTVSDELPVVAPIVSQQMNGADVLAALARVSEPYQAAVALFYLQDWSYKEIALILEVSVGTVKSRISRGVAQLRGLLADDGGASSEANGTLVAHLPGNSSALGESYKRSVPLSTRRSVTTVAFAEASAEARI